MSWSPIDNNARSKEVIGDDPFDLISACFGKVAQLYKRDWKRKPSLRELLGTVEAVLAAQLQDHTTDGESAELVSLTFKTQKIPKRQKYAKGDVVKAVAANGKPIYGRIFDVERAIGPLVGVYDSLGMSQTDLDAIIQRPLVVKVFPTHPETLEKREWLVIGNRPVTRIEAKLPRGPMQVGGENQQLQAANYYYGFGKKAFYNIEDCLAQKKRPGAQKSRRSSG
jgi:hypothetical protein